MHISFMVQSITKGGSGTIMYDLTTVEKMDVTDLVMLSDRTTCITGLVEHNYNFFIG